MIVPLTGFWILDPLYNTLGVILSAVYAVVPSFAVAIAVLTIVVSLVRVPLVTKQVKSQRAMQEIQPEIKRLQAKFKADPQQRNEEVMKIYKERGVNPLAGCLPVLLQMPLFIVLYRLILDLNAQPDPKHLPRTGELFLALKESGGAMRSFGVDLAKRASDASGFGSLLPYAILIVAVVATGLFQQRQMASRLPKDGVNAQMQMIGKIMPLFFGFISYSLPAGVVLYFLVSQGFQIGQQAYLFHRGHLGPLPVRDADGEEPRKIRDDSSGEGPPSRRTRGGRGSGGGGSGGGGSGGGGSGGRGKAGTGGLSVNGRSERRGNGGRAEVRAAPPKRTGRVTPPKRDATGGTKAPGGGNAPRGGTPEKGRAGSRSNGAQRNRGKGL